MADKPAPPAPRPPRSEAAGRLLPEADRRALHLRLLAVRVYADKKDARP